MNEDEQDLVKRGFWLEIQKAQDGSLVAVASTNTTDRHGEIVDNNGWDLKAYKKNPLILWAHNHDEPAIGMSAKTWVEGTGKKAQLMIKPVLHEVTEKSKAVKALVEMGIIKALSVGFRPIESPDGITFSKNELLEVSVVNVPANADAMMMAYKGLKQAGFEKEVIEQVGVQVDEARIEALEKEVSDIKEKLVKAAPVNPKRQTEERISMLKVIAKASDKLLEANNKRVVVDQRRLVKTIKRATEIMTVAEKDNLNG